MKSVVVYLTLAVVAAALMESTSARRFCDTAADKVLCAQLTGRARKWDRAMTNALIGVQKRAADMKSVTDAVAVKLPADMNPVSRDDVISTCRENYDTIMYNLEESLALVKGNPNDLKARIASFSFFDCTFAIGEFDASVDEANQFDSELLKLDDSLRALIDKKKNKLKAQPQPQPQPPCPALEICA